MDIENYLNQLEELILVMILVVFSANLCCAEEYQTRTIHHPGLFEALGGLVVTAVVLPFAIVGGLAQGLTTLVVGSDEVIVTRTPQPAVIYTQPRPAVPYPTQVVPAVYVQPVAQIVYNQPYYTMASMDPGYQYDYWYWQPGNRIVFVVGKEHRRHQCNTDGRQIHYAKDERNRRPHRDENRGSGRQQRTSNDDRRHNGQRGDRR